MAWISIPGEAQVEHLHFKVTGKERMFLQEEPLFPKARIFTKRISFLRLIGEIWGIDKEARWILNCFWNCILVLQRLVR